MLNIFFKYIEMFTSKISIIPEYQQQSGQQKSFDINFNPYLHPINVQTTPTTSMFASNPFQRTFASVVSCKPPIMQKQQSNDRTARRGNNEGIFNSFLKKIVYQKSSSRAMLPPKIPYFEPSHVQKEFEDFKTLPSYLQNQRTTPKSNSHTMHASNINKNRHEKQRHSIEHDIRVDCDILNIKKVNNSNNKAHRNSMRSSTSTDLPNNNNKNKNSMENSKSPPFEIYSLEEFPAIATAVVCTSQYPNSSTASSSTKVVDESDESDYVKYQDDIAKITPTFIPRRMNLCEKVTNIVKSPKKLLNIPMISPKRSCLKPTPRRRTVSECSDDFIVFDRSCCEDSSGKDNVDIDSDNEFNDEESDVSDEEDDGITDLETEDECDGTNNFMEEESDDINLESHQPDSGMEEKKVHFSLVPKVHVIIAWDHAYRQARKGDLWRQCAVDRQRFAKRIADCGDVINPILDKCHRNRVYQDRFQVKTE